MQAELSKSVAKMIDDGRPFWYNSSHRNTVPFREISRTNLGGCVSQFTAANSLKTETPVRN